MCLIISQDAQPQILEEDMVVYKTVSRSLTTKYYSEILRFEYELGKTYSSELLVADPNDPSKEYLDKEYYLPYDDHDEKIMMSILPGYNKYRVNKEFPIYCDFKSVTVGIHSFMGLPSTIVNRYSSFDVWYGFESAIRALVKCIIPKGSTVYINSDTGMVASDQIVLVEEVKEISEIVK